jgi:hypothetical protein
MPNGASRHQEEWNHKEHKLINITAFYEACLRRRAAKLGNLTSFFWTCSPKTPCRPNRLSIAKTSPENRDPRSVVEQFESQNASRDTS